MKSIYRFFIYPIFILGISFALTPGCKKDDNTENTPPKTVTDIDGNVYHTVTIGTQVWLVENLKTTKYRNGDTISNVTDEIHWGSLTTGAYCNYLNDTSYASTYGRLYNWYTVTDSRNIAPAGWHVPSNEEWTTLINFLGGDSVAGGKLKETGTAHWLSPNKGATNETGFTALPGGLKLPNDPNLHFAGIGSDGSWWSLGKTDLTVPWGIDIRSYESDARLMENFPVNYGFSVRCLMD
jgi:uncharacterized protein (TIGR02145 family)